MDEQGIVKSVSWQDLCPWLILTRAFRISVSFSVLLLSLSGVVLSSAGWSFSAYCFLSDNSLNDNEFQARIENVNAWQSYDSAEAFGRHLDGESQDLKTLIHKVSSSSVFASIVYPFLCLFNPELEWDRWGYFAFGGTWSVAVWAFAGLAIARIAVVRFGTGEVVMLKEAIVYAATKWISCFSAPLLPYAGIFVLAVPMFLLGVMIRVSDWGILFAGLVWVVPIACGFLMALISLGLFFGWPLMFGTLAAEGSDAFDAISRSYSFTFQRPLRYVAYAAIALVLGTLGCVVVYSTIELLIHFCIWMTSWTGETRWSKIREVRNRHADLLPVFAIGVHAMDFGFQIVRSFLSAYVYAYFWTAYAAIYLLLRQDTDSTELDDIYFADDDRNPHSLPEFSQDAYGVPKVPDQ